MAKPRPAPAKKASDPMTLMNLTAGKWVSQAIAVAAELGIADVLKDGPKTVSIGCSAPWGALGSSPRPETGDSDSLRSAGYSAETRPKRSGAMRDS